MSEEIKYEMYELGGCWYLREANDGLYSSVWVPDAGKE